MCVCVCVCIYKWLILPKKHENNDIEVIVHAIGKLWLNEKHVEEKVANNFPVITNMTQYTKSTDIN